MNKTLAVKYRPKDFEDVAGQSAVVQILQQQITDGTHKQAYLFTGGAGTGKTTLARIFAKELNEGSTGVIELDAASNNGVDDVRELIESAKRKSLDSTYKVFILDECHAFSANAWAAMLKLLEEPPRNTVFVMCTTDPQRIPDTILSRVQRFDFAKLSKADITNRLLYIVEEEKEEGRNVTLHTDALDYIIGLADGGMRDAINLLDKTLSYNEDATLENTIVALGTGSMDSMRMLLRSLMELSPKAHELIQDVYYEGVDIKQYMRNFKIFVMEMALVKMFNDFSLTSIPSTQEFRYVVEDYDLYEMLDVLEFANRVSNEIKWETSAKAIVNINIMLYMKEKRDE